ncbi:MAG: hypothetical protein U9R32_09340 [Bacteroidota bacterium]|nr:hypothetical protein [Bacteroidota bacterium]
MAERRRKKAKYRKVAFKLSERQKKSLEAYCVAADLTLIKCIKKSIKDITEGDYHRSMPLMQINSKQIDLEDLIRELDGNKQLEEQEEVVEEKTIDDGQLSFMNELFGE